MSREKTPCGPGALSIDVIPLQEGSASLWLRENVEDTVHRTVKRSELLTPQIHLETRKNPETIAAPGFLFGSGRRIRIMGAAKNAVNCCQKT